MRPILMTTLTTVVSMVPMAMALGDSGSTTQGLALVNIGGLTASTILSLLMLPAYYSLMNGGGKKRVIISELTNKKDMGWRISFMSFFAALESLPR